MCTSCVIFIAGCVTEYGHDCVFPFEFMGVRHDKCAFDEESAKYWCATEVNNDTLEYIDWDYCKKDVCKTGKPSAGKENL